MNCKTSAMLGFLTGIALGGIATWYYSKEKYTFIAEQEKIGRASCRERV